MYPLGMPLKRVKTTTTFHVPQPDRPIPTRAGQLATIGCKRQSAHPTGMPRKARNAGGRVWCLHLPQSNAPIEAAAGEQATIRAPSHREDRSGMRQGLEVCAALGVPEPDGGIIPTAGQCATIGGKGQAYAGGLPNGPEWDPTLQLPQGDCAIPAPAGESAFVRAEGEG